MKVKEFIDSISIENALNAFLHSNPNIKIIDIKYMGTQGRCGDKYSFALVVYEE